MDENKRKHLEFIQDVISRMAGNLFYLKGWSITLVATGLGFLAITGISAQSVLVVALPVATFWLLDGYFLAQERQYRDLFKKVAATPASDIDFSMDASPFNRGYNTWWCAFFSKTLVCFYGPMIATIVTVAVLR